MRPYLNWLARLELTKAIIGKNVPDDVADQIISDFEVRMSRFKNENRTGYWVKRPTVNGPYYCTACNQDTPIVDKQVMLGERCSACGARMLNPMKV